MGEAVQKKDGRDLSYRGELSSNTRTSAQALLGNLVGWPGASPENPWTWNRHCRSGHGRFCFGRVMFPRSTTPHAADRSTRDIDPRRAPAASAPGARAATPHLPSCNAVARDKTTSPSNHARTWQGMHSRAQCQRACLHPHADRGLPMSVRPSDTTRTWRPWQIMFLYEPCYTYDSFCPITVRRIKRAVFI
jgi:hypothetical protein